MFIQNRNCKVCFLVFWLCACFTRAQSEAHSKSAAFIIDPAYNTERVFPESPVEFNAPMWVYGRGELESWRLNLLIARKDTAGLNVGYPGVIHIPANQLEFRFVSVDSVYLSNLIIAHTGQGRVYLDDTIIGRLSPRNRVDTIHIGLRKGKAIRIALASENDPPAFKIEAGPFASNLSGWESKLGSGVWEGATAFHEGKFGTLPHRIEDPLLSIKPRTFKDHLYDFGREMYGYIRVQSDRLPELYFGESETEARDVLNDRLEQSDDFVPDGPGSWRSKVPLAFRYVYLPGMDEVELICEAPVYPAQYQGAFACSDPGLNQIWMNSAYTLRLCMHDFLLDGMKRDRLPWSGDLAMSMLVNSFTFADAEMVRRSLVALGNSGIAQADINGIIDYSLWWVISQDQYQIYFGDRDHLSREWQKIKDAMTVLSARTDDVGFLQIENGDWLFIDWVDQPKWTALQILWWWSLKSAAALASRMGDFEHASSWEFNAVELQKVLREKTWDPKRKVWLAAPGTVPEYTRHPNIIAMVSGLTPADASNGILDLFEDNSIPAVGTPYMAGYEMMARAALGSVNYTLEKINSYWGGMLELGATSFWEAYDPLQQGKEHYSFYGRPYAKSLCHAWSSGPAAILPMAIFGIKPIGDGMKEIEIDPDPGYLKWVYATIPTPSGSINIELNGNLLQIEIPENTTVHFKGERLVGPARVQRKITR